MELLKDIIAEDLFLYLKKYESFIISDIHLGYEETLNRQGVLIPRFNYNDLTIRIEKAIHKIYAKGYRIKEIIINGDLLHSFSKISRDEKFYLTRIFELLNKYGNIIVLKGNHDKALSFLLANDVKFVNELIYNDILIVHGDSINKHSSSKKIKTIIIGHEHPSIALNSGIRTEKYKCFLKGKYKNQNLIVTPSCNLFIEGSDVLREKMLSPYIKNIQDFETYIIEDKIYDFGKLKKLIDKQDKKSYYKS